MRLTAKLDYTIEDPQERLKLVNQILEELDTEPSEKYLEILANYLVFCMEKKERRERKIITENRQVTLNKRETSWQELAEKLENGDDGIYNISNHSRGKAILLQPKTKITKKDIEEIPDLRQLREAIDNVEEQSHKSSGREKFILCNTLIEMRRTQYIIKNAFRKPLYPNKIIHTRHAPELKEEVWINEYGKVKGSGVSLLKPNVVMAILNNYKRLKDESYGRVNDDIWYVVYDFEQTFEKALKDYPVYKELAKLKIEGYQNIEIVEILENKYGVKYNPEFISTIWCKKIPKMIVSAEEDNYLSWYFLNVKKGNYKKCSKCGQIKLAHNKYFSRNSMSGDGFYSICKECRNRG